MDLGCVLSLSVWVVLISTLGAERGSSVEVRCPCLGIPSVDHTVPERETCFKKDERFRYKCEEGYVRKAGTSNLIKCVCTTEDSQCSWSPSPPLLTCISDPKIIAKQPQNTTKPMTTPPAAASTRPQTTQSLSPSASVTTETSSTEPTSLESTSLESTPVESTSVESTSLESTSLEPTSLESTSLEPTSLESTSLEPTSLEPTSLEPTSLESTALKSTSLESDQSQVNLVKTTQEEETTATPTTTIKPPDIRTANPLLSANLSSETKAGLSCALLVIVLALSGLIFWSYRRRSKHNIPQETPDVEIPMNPAYRTADSETDPMATDAADVL